jgi:hypothetical protein
MQTILVQKRKAQSGLGADILVEHAQQQNWQAGEYLRHKAFVKPHTRRRPGGMQSQHTHNIVHLTCGFKDELLSRETHVNLVPVLRQHGCDVLVEHVADQDTHAVVIPTAVHKQQTLQELHTSHHECMHANVTN